jgi:hypothetical protein
MCSTRRWTFALLRRQSQEQNLTVRALAARLVAEARSSRSGVT